MFAYVGPQGSMILLKERIPITRFVFWSFVVIIGVFYTFLIINVDYSQVSGDRGSGYNSRKLNVLTGFDNSCFQVLRRPNVVYYECCSRRRYHISRDNGLPQQYALQGAARVIS